MRTSLLTLTFFAFAAVASGHDYWLQPATFTPAVAKPVALSLHVGDHFRSEGERAHQKKLTRSFTLFSGEKKVEVAARDGDKPIAKLTLAKAGTHLVALERDAVRIVLEGKKFTEYLQEEGLSEIVAARKKAGESEKEGRERYRRYLKCYLRAGDTGDDTWKQVAGHKLEIVPLSDPTATKKGETLKLRVEFDGKPLVGVQVQAFSRIGEKVKARTAKTSDKGEASFELGESGMVLVRLVYMRRAMGDKEADWLSWWSSLSFEVR